MRKWQHAPSLERHRTRDARAPVDFVVVRFGRSDPRERLARSRRMHGRRALRRTDPLAAGLEPVSDPLDRPVDPADATVPGVSGSRRLASPRRRAGPRRHRLVHGAERRRARAARPGYRQGRPHRARRRLAAPRRDRRAGRRAVDHRRRAERDRARRPGDGRVTVLPPPVVRRPTRTSTPATSMRTASSGSRGRTGSTAGSIPARKR